MKKKLSMIITIIAMLMLVTACGNKSASSDGKVTLTWWDAYTDTDGTVISIKNAIKKYEEAHPNIKIERVEVPFAELKKKLLLGAAGGELPDIVIIDNPDHQAMAAAGVLADITDNVKEWGESDSYFEGPWSSTIYKGKNYGVPLGSNNLALFYNKELLDKAGIKPPTNWNELTAAAEKLTDKSKGIYGMSVSAIKSEEGTFQFLPFVWQAGSDLNNFNSEGTVKAITLWKNLIDNGYMPKDILTQNQQDIALQFINGKTAMMVNGTWQTSNLQQKANFDWDIVQLPEDKKGGTILGGENFAVTSTSEHKDEAWDVLEFIQQKDVLKELVKEKGYIPARKDLVEDDYWQNDKLLKPFADSMQVAKARAYGSKYPSISDEIQNMIQGVLTGESTPEEAVKQTAEKIKPYLSE
ncbi:sugar ABC transporter substrate-binding protein [Niallia sp. NCCP-28]|uniref:sugar ABC transporter substrate-binding protein n=1 Tax=Niallia sp. NCCP-28 TaxID=2934712 RepID=UPI00208D0071|nr:sugar ABC transporter substrate-binding protein [Niallia sp. NCCP-28]GKU82040.1 sugar ABC transporter substrate-binding protein [Niallia sp. NCCP-28]